MNKAINIGWLLYFYTFRYYKYNFLKNNKFVKKKGHLK